MPNQHPIPHPKGAGRFACLLISMLMLLPGGSAQAARWVDAGDAGLRADIELLAAYGLIDSLTTTWPIPDGQLSRLAESPKLLRQPEFVQQAAQRVLATVDRHETPHLAPLAAVRLTNAPDTVRDYSSLARDEADIRAGVDLTGTRLSASLLAGEQTHFNGSGARTAFDGSQVSAVVDNWQVYGGEVDQWYGPGWVSSLILSNNARPLPKVGIMRNDPHAFGTPWLSWLGPWQLNFFVGLLDGPRTDRNTALGSLRLTFSPFHNFEIGLTRATEFCGQHHPCNLTNAAFHFGNSNGNQNSTNEEATIEFRYTALLGSHTLTPYVQFMNEDTGPFVHSYTSYLTGSSLTGGWGENGAQWRLTAEVTDSVATLSWFTFNHLATGYAYNNNAGYVDGFRYRDRTLGFSLDSDSRLLSLAGSVTDPKGWTYSLIAYHANISTAALTTLHQTDPNFSNVVSAQPVIINQLQAGLVVPWRAFKLNLSMRAQDAQVYPKSGGQIAGEVGVQYGF